MKSGWSACFLSDVSEEIAHWSRPALRFRARLRYVSSFRSHTTPASCSRLIIVAPSGSHSPDDFPREAQAALQQSAKGPSTGIPNVRTVSFMRRTHRFSQARRNLSSK